MQIKSFIFRLVLKINIFTFEASDLAHIVKVVITTY